jgi:hypothetical protein
MLKNVIKCCYIHISIGYQNWAEMVLDMFGKSNMLQKKTILLIGVGSRPNTNIIILC